MSDSYRFIEILLITVLLTSCRQPAGIPANNPPWPVTGPIGDNIVNEGDSFALEITGDSGLITDPAHFDPDGDVVDFIVVLDSIEDLSKNPVVSVSPNGVFSVIWRPELTGAYIYAYYSISTSDGALTTSPTEQITVFYY